MLVKVMTDAKGKGKSEWSEEAEFTTQKKMCGVLCVYGKNVLIVC